MEYVIGVDIGTTSVKTVLYDIQDCIDHLIVAENAERLKESEL